MKKKILIVDDDLNQHKINQFYFKKHGFDVVSAFTGEDGLEKILTERPALVLLDFMMPGMNGEQFLHILWNDPKYQPVGRTPVVMLTAAGHERDFVEKLMDRGARRLPAETLRRA
ncbi:MAG: response regulator [candidate division KSB1 bacterium]|nr:response regulator [candidate division KSB1 bacterium]